MIASSISLISSLLPLLLSSLLSFYPAFIVVIFGDFVVGDAVIIYFVVDDSLASLNSFIPFSNINKPFSYLTYSIND